MSTLTPQDLKLEAQTLRQQQAEQGTTITRSQALEQVAKNHGFRDWNTASATLSEEVSCPVSIGQEISGRYMKQLFTGEILDCTAIPKSRLFRVNIKFAEPVDVVTFKSFSNFRTRVSAKIDTNGVSPERTNDGQPHLVITLEETAG